ncbi:MAG TPA: trypsin-like peptidase domain-containing protein [Candidatus Saccharimonadales bacterium]
MEDMSGMSEKPTATDRHSKPALGPEHPKIRFLAMAALLIVSLAAGFLGGWLAAKDQSAVVSPVEKQQVILKSQGELINQIAKDVGASVVSIETTATTQSFFGSRESQGAGTGIILTEDGLIITNRHVVPTGTSGVKVILSDGTEFEGVSVVGRTSSRDSLDIAFIKINDTKGKKLKPAKIGDSAKMQVGDPVVAIGNALGQFQNTVTSGIISGYGRNIQAADSEGGENLENLFQTDTAINPGNSGGPLVNLDGQVVGINTAVAGGDAQNIGFAIPINDVMGLIDSVKQTGKLQRPYLGVIYIPLSNASAGQYGLSVNHGAYIAPPAITGGDPLVDGGPAEKAGLKAGDVITQINGTAIDQSNSLSGLINKHRVGDKVTLTIVRDGKEQKIDVTLGAAPTS